MTSAVGGWRRLRPARVRSVDDDRIRLQGFEDLPLDVAFDDQRVWSFWVRRDTEGSKFGERSVEWPANLRRHMNGHTRLVISEHVSGRVLFDEERRFGEGDQRLTVVNKQGVPLGLDKSGRLTPTFEGRSPDQVKPLLDAVETVIAELAAAGVDAFPGYGTLLGAVREQQLLGHDSDADLCYVSRHRRPVDVALESFRLQRALAERGYPIRRYSGGAFKVEVVEADGVRRGLDVFGGFLDDLPDGTERLYLMGEVGVPFRSDWIFPLGTCALEGRTFPAPAKPEPLLEAMYGRGWKVPDPAFHFETPERVVRQLDGWFRGTRPNRSNWDARFSTVGDVVPAWSERGSTLAVAMIEREGGLPKQVVDLGCGRGADGLWLARQGVEVIGYDWSTRGAQAASLQAREEGHRFDLRMLSLNEWRSVLVEGARLVRDETPRVLLARHVADAVTPFARDAIGRLASMALRNGGRLYLDVWTGQGKAPGAGLTPRDPDEVVTILERHGARILSAENIPAGTPGYVGSVGRLVAEWT